MFEALRTDLCRPAVPDRRGSAPGCYHLLDLERERSFRGRARFTVRFRPSSGRPFSFLIASSASTWRVHFDETKSFGLSRILILDQVYACHLAEFFEQCLELPFGYTVG